MLNLFDQVAILHIIAFLIYFIAGVSFARIVIGDNEVEDAKDLLIMTLFCLLWPIAVVLIIAIITLYFIVHGIDWVLKKVVKIRH